MKEDFLHYVWKYQKFAASVFYTVSGESIRVVHPGQHNGNSGPDFLNAQLIIDNQRWAGNVEIHLKSSDWYVHHHQDDCAYDSVLLHVVWEYNVAVFRANDAVIPALEIKNLVLPLALKGYDKLQREDVQFIPCERDFPRVDQFILDHWLEGLYLERLQQKTAQIIEEVSSLNNHWEALLFQQLCKTFGLKVNGVAFLSIAQSIPFSVVVKCRHNLQTLEALFLGQAGLLDTTINDDYIQGLKETYAFLKKKFNLCNKNGIAVNFFRLRPSNFPTVRLVQLAALYASNNHLFSAFISIKSKEEAYRLFAVQASTYWDTHFNIGVVSSKKEKVLTKKFIDLVLINTVIPLQFCYAQQQGTEISEEILALATAIAPEKNMIVKQFDVLRPKAKNAMQSQALLQLKQTYCKPKRCLDCAIGNVILTTEQ